MTSGAFLFIHTCFWGLRGTQLGAIREWKKSLGSVQPADPAGPFHFPKAVVSDSGSKTPKLVRYRHHWKTDPLGWEASRDGGLGTVACWVRAAGEMLKVSVAFVHQSKNSRSRWAVSLGTHIAAQSFSFSPVWRTMNVCVRTGPCALEACHYYEGLSHRHVQSTLKSAQPWIKLTSLWFILWHIVNYICVTYQLAIIIVHYRCYYIKLNVTI